MHRWLQQRIQMARKQQKGWVYESNHLLRFQTKTNSKEKWRKLNNIQTRLTWCKTLPPSRPQRCRRWSPPSNSSAKRSRMFSHLSNHSSHRPLNAARTSVLWGKVASHKCNTTKRVGQLLYLNNKTITEGSQPASSWMRLAWTRSPTW